MKKLMLIAMLLGLLTGVGVAQRGRAGGAVSPTARPDVDMSARRAVGVSPTLAPNRTMTINRGVSPTAAPIKDPTIGRSTIAPSGTSSTRSVDPTAAPVRDPLIDASPTAAGSSTVNRNASPVATQPIRDPK